MGNGLTKLAERRARRGLSVEKLAEMTGVFAGTIRDIEAGRTRKPRLPTLHRLAGGLGCELVDLIEEESVTLVCIVCRKLVQGQPRHVGTTCPYCETGELRIAKEDDTAKSEVAR